MNGVFYHSVIHGLGFFGGFLILHPKTIKHAFSVLYSDKIWRLFGQSERAQGPIYIIKGNKIMVFSYPQKNFTKTSKVRIMRDPKRITFIHRLSLFITLGG